MDYAKPPGFDTQEWLDAIASGRVILVAPPPARRAWWSGLPRPLAATVWLITRAARVRMATARDPLGGASNGVCAPPPGAGAAPDRR